MDAVIHSSVDWLPTAALVAAYGAHYSDVSTARLSNAVCAYTPVLAFKLLTQMIEAFRDSPRANC